MMPEPEISTELQQPRGRPFPWYCPKCRRQEVRLAIMPYRCARVHQGRLITVNVPQLSVPRCAHCGELVFNYGAEEQITRALLDQCRKPSLDGNGPENGQERTETE